MNVTLPNGKIIRNVPEGVTKDEIRMKAISAGLATEADFASPSPVSEGFQRAPEQPEQRQKKQKVEGIFMAPELNEFSMRAFKTGLGGLLTGDEEALKGIITKNYPDAEFGTIQGQQAVRMPSGTYFLSPEGLSGDDIARLGFDVASYTPAGRILGTGAKQLAKGAIAGGATETLQQGAEAGLGGEFSPGEVALETAIGPIGQVAAEAIPVAAKAVKEKASSIWESMAQKAGTQNAEKPYEALADTISKGKTDEVVPEIMADQKILEDAQFFGIDLNPAHYSDNSIYRQLEASLRAMPNSQLAPKENEAIRRLGEEADKVIELFGGDVDASLVSAQYRQRADNVVESLSNQAKGLYTKLDEAIPASLIVKPRNINDYLRKRATELGGEQYLAPVERDLLNRLGEGTKPTYARLVQARKDLMAGRSGRGVFKDATQGQIDHLYGLLKSDEEVVSKGLGVYDLAKAASDSVRKRKLIEDKITDAIGRDLSKSLMVEVGAGVRGLTKGDTKRFVKVMGGVPADMKQQVAVTALNNLFRGGTTTSKAFTPGGFVTGYEALQRNKTAAGQLWKHVPAEAKERIDKIYRISKGIMKATEIDRANPSGTAKQVIAALDSDDGIFKRLYDLGRVALPAEGATTTMGMPGVGIATSIMHTLGKTKAKFSQMADRMLTDPDFQKAVTLFTNGHANAAEKVLTRGPRFKAWYNALPDATKQQIMRQGAANYLINGSEEEAE